MKRKLLATMLLLVPFGGCASLDDCCYEHTQSARAMVQYVKCGNPDSSCYPHDYKLGWIDGFYEVSTGGSTCPPAVAPARYWKPGQILKDCDNKRHAYYSGWQDGAARAEQFPDTHTIRIFETCECPFPRCEEPCADGTCVPCGMPTIGMPVSDEMIEMAPVPMPTVETTDIEKSFSDLQAAAAKKNAATNLEVGVLPNITEDGDKQSSTEISAGTVTRPSAPASEPELVARKNVRSIEAKPASARTTIVRMAEPIAQSLKATTELNDASGNAIALPAGFFEMIETEPVVKLAE
ncbi:hypothetical protein [Rhodopirellula sp. P2]|uniref:hypothetical protein n=1 Tax=Rhodopirellula sp. P2 TaxID=2127060 RepID=UPI002367CEEC|nr:hypothetical protein [Rhodopirellula sp. P2]WDQ17498.1 hypothetical protein PSR62_02850 [Rhodopirellula sp. P2]